MYVQLLHLTVLVIIGTLISAIIWTTSKLLSEKLLYVYKKIKRKKQLRTAALERKKEYNQRQNDIKLILERLWKDESFASMMHKYQSINRSALYEKNVLRRIRKALGIKIRTKVRSQLDIHEQVYFSEITGRLKLH